VVVAFDRLQALAFGAPGRSHQSELNADEAAAAVSGAATQKLRQLSNCCRQLKRGFSQKGVEFEFAELIVPKICGRSWATPVGSPDTAKKDEPV